MYRDSLNVPNEAIWVCECRCYRFTATATKIVGLQAAGPDSRGESVVGIYPLGPRWIKGQCVTAIIVNADVKINKKVCFLRLKKRAPKMIFNNVIFGVR